MEIEGHRTDIILAMQVISLFSGIGGFELAAEWAGWDNVVSCEINPFGRRVLEYYWPNSYHHDDIHTLNRETIEKNSRWNKAEPTVIVGGFPCQPYSLAGKRKGKEDERHLWPQMLRLIQEISPEWVVGENVFGIVNWSGGLVFDEVQTDLEAAGYEVQPYVLPACSVNAPHRRDRVWFVAHNTSKGRSKGDGQETDIQGWEMAEPGQKRDGIRNDIGTSNKTGSGTTENSMRSRCLQREFNEEGTEIWKQRNISTGDSERIHLSEGTAPDSDNPGSGNGLRIDRERTEKNQQEQPQFEYRSDGSKGTAPDTQRYGQPGQEHRQKEPGWTAKKSVPDDWSNFPTQPPVCGRNDGISSRLVGITVSKHRNESIKAYGNAIVPQVAFQIFKAINEYEK